MAEMFQPFPALMTGTYSVCPAVVHVTIDPSLEGLKIKFIMVICKKMQEAHWP